MKIRTHDGVFHADEAMAVAIIQLLHNEASLPKPEVVRTRRDIEADLCIDVGLRNDGKVFFDHHQPGGAGARLGSGASLGVPFASAGLVWKAYGLQLCKLHAMVSFQDHQIDLMHELVDTRLIRPIDAVDTGWNRLNPTGASTHFSFSELIRSLNDLENGKNEAWDEALHICRVALMAAIQGAANSVNLTQLTERAVNEAIIRKLDTVVLPGFVTGWHSFVYAAPGNEILKFAAYLQDKGEREQWMVEAIPKAAGDTTLRNRFPESWGGLPGLELQKLTGVPEALFCHASGFLCATETLEGAMKLARAAAAQAPVAS